MIALLAACGSRERPVDAAKPGVVTITARGLAFEGPDRIPPGWTTFRFDNQSTMTHFAVIEKLPAGKGIADQQLEIAPLFQDGMNLLVAGDAEGAQKKFGELPEWFGEIVFTGGPGLTAPGVRSETTVWLDPGRYLLECYVKTNGVFHSVSTAPGTYGMVHELWVEGEPSNAREPEASIHIHVSSGAGFTVEGAPAIGLQTVAVHFDDQKLQENFVGHDVHLVRLAEGTSAESVGAWMDWSQPHGLETPAPAAFLGGLEEMPAGSTGYFTVTLAPGRYAWIAEVPDPETKGMLKVFDVGDGGGQS